MTCHAASQKNSCELFSEGIVRGPIGGRSLAGTPSFIWEKYEKCLQSADFNYMDHDNIADYEQGKKSFEAAYYLRHKLIKFDIERAMNLWTQYKERFRL